MFHKSLEADIDAPIFRYFFFYECNRSYN